MQKIEKWRIQELAFLLSKLTDLLRKGTHPEWANVFLHFHQEIQRIISANILDSGLLKKVIASIKNCFLQGSSFINIKLEHENLEENTMLNQDFRFTRAHLLKILSDIEKKMIEHIN